MTSSGDCGSASNGIEEVTRISSCCGDCCSVGDNCGEASEMLSCCNEFCSIGKAFAGSKEPKRSYEAVGKAKYVEGAEKLRARSG